MRNFRNLAFASVSLAAIAMPAYAQDAAAEEGKSDDQIVVTGTLICGTKVVGAQTIAIDAQTITERGASSTNELLSLMPQISNTFNGRFEGDPRGFARASRSTRRTCATCRVTTARPAASRWC